MGRCLALLLCALLYIESIPATRAQEAPAGPRLNIVIVEGDGAINNIRQRTAREPIVQVEDENHKPIAGAAVVFTLTSNGGGGGVFANGSHTLTVVSDAQGRAVATGLKPNAAGNMQIQVNASYQGIVGHAVIMQTNVLASAAASAGTTAGVTAAKAGIFLISTKVLVIVAIAAAAAAAGGACAAACGSASKTATSTGPVITAGPGTVGAPH